MYQLSKPTGGFTGCSSRPASGSAAWNQWHPLVPWEQGNVSSWGNRIAIDLLSRTVDSLPQMSTGRGFQGFHRNLSELGTGDWMPISRWSTIAVFCKCRCLSSLLQQEFLLLWNYMGKSVRAQYMEVIGRPASETYPDPM